MKPAILVALLFRTLDAFRIFDTIFIMTNGAQQTPRSVSILGYNQLLTRLNLGLGSAVSVLIFLCVLLIAFLFVKGFGATSPRNGGTAVMRRIAPRRSSIVVGMLAIVVVLLRADPGALDRVAVAQDAGDGR